MKSTLRLLSILVLFYLLPQVVFTQSQEVTGQVTSAENGAPLIGVTVQIKDAGVGTTTDIDGNYTIRVENAASTLVVSYLGYQAQEIKVENRTTIDIQLSIDSQVLDEVVVIGYGSMKKSDLTGSVFSVKAEELIKNPASNPLQALQSKVPGVQISSSSGDPGSSPVVRIRGIATMLGGASPIFVVDGVILDDISFLNSGDVASVEVLKDASATAIYGTRGANGVIIFTTKRGKEGKAVINVGSTYSVEQVSDPIDLLNGRAFAMVVNELQPGTYNNLDLLPDTDWQDEIFSAAPIQKHEISFSGAKEGIQYYLGGSYFDQKGIIDKSGYNRISVKLNTTFQVSPQLKLGTNLTFSKEQKDNAPNVVAAAYRAWPTSEPFDEDGALQEVQGSGNPLASIEYSNSSGKRLRGIGNFYAEANFLKDFSVKTSFQTDLGQINATSFTPKFFVSPTQMNDINDLSKSSRQEITWIWENTINYSKEIKNHRFGLLAGYTVQETKNETIGGSVEDLVRESEDLWYLGAGDETTLNATNFIDNYSYLSYLFRANYTLNDRYLFTATFRRDGSSKFGTNNRYGNFPSLALGWRITEEPFMEKISSVSNLKFRASWGINGNDKIPYQARFARISSSDLLAIFGQEEVEYAGATLTDAGNASLQWENTQTYDAGLEFGFFNHKLSGEIDYFRKRTNKVLVPLLLPAHFGNGPFNRVIFNAADVENKGWELFINWNDRYKKFHYGIGFLASQIKNKVLDIGAADEFLSDGSLGNGQLVTRTEKGLAVGSFYGYKVIGVLQNDADIDQFATIVGQKPGDLRYEDLNNDGEITADDRQVLGSNIPDILLGMNLKLGYQGFELNVDLQAQLGNEIYNGKKAVRPELYNFESNVLDRWTGEGSTNEHPKVTTGGLNYLPSSYFIEDGSFLRIRSVSLVYTPSNNFLSKMKISGANFFLRATNLFTFTKFTGYSPEIASQNVLSSGIDLGVYPISTTYSIGFNLTL